MTKCHFVKDKLQYLDHVVSNKSIKVDPREIENITKRHRPLEIGQFWYFLGLCNYFHKSIHKLLYYSGTFDIFDTNQN